MTRKAIRNVAIAVFAMTAVPSVTHAAVNGADASYEREDDDDGFDWGLLGLLGLAGLLGLRKNEPDVHVDARRDTRP
ncbi:MAG: hypothetical protein AVDCRST_MAG31-2348 [uncultured Sphingomonas sp.]|uniref:Uncharacterized protein n=1 Tax=uncultured Sphingomonas sp. TaxID=158754 RepID=A0A6J4TRX1_9SPHN|nr:WGxxGxxG family protein [uncultured Sphingomonas sp.]CAA9530598.1 MAG: hypothetical protein AVDCRST_MAG31-2348 [uncultured Sphingomonas sp.]